MKLIIPGFNAPESMHRLDPARIVATAENLAKNVNERLPGSTLARLSVELEQLARVTDRRARDSQKPIHVIRALSFLASSTAILLLGLIAKHIHTRWVFATASDLFQATDAGVNLCVIFGGLLWFFASFESRLKRRRTLDSLVELREFIHVIDITQLYYTPDLYKNHGKNASADQKLDYTYLLFCTQLIALIGNLAPLYTRGSAGDSIFRAASEVEVLANATVTKLQAKADSVRIVAALP